MWNFSFIFPSLLVLAVIVGFYYALPRIPIRMNITFLRLIAVECIVMVLDIISSFADTDYQQYPVWLLYLLNSLYFIAFLARAYFFYIITGSIVRLSVVLRSKTRRILTIPFILASFIVIITPWTRWFYYIDETGYHSAPLYYLLYVIFWFYLLHSFFGILHRKKDLLKKKELMGTLWYNGILLAGTFIRLLFPKYLLMDTFCLQALIIIYLTFENPDFYLEGRTWIFNSKALMEYLQEINEEKYYSIFAFSVHNFKDISQIHGNNQIETAIRLISAFLKKSFPKQKLFYCRSGRFVILFEEKYDPDMVRNRLQARFAEAWNTDDMEIYFDIGCAILEPRSEGLPFEHMTTLLLSAFKEAELADKHEIMIIGNDYIEKAQQETAIKKSIEYAIKHNTVEVYLQPIVDAKTEKLVGAEALARIRDNDNKLISPALFIPIAEHNGRINSLGEQMFIKVCEFIKNNDMKALGLSWINVNLSPIQFMRANLGRTLVETIKIYGIDHDFIHLEITEEAMVDEQLLVNQTNEISSYGFNLVLDDYGKGFSNLKRLRSCPFINIKLDMSIVWDYCKNPDDMLPNMINTFTTMGFKTTAEGIENEEMSKMMKDIGCSYFQGYYYSKPLPIDEFLKKYKPGTYQR